MIIKIPGYVTVQENSYTGEPLYSFSIYDPTPYDVKSKNPRVIVCEHVLELEIADSYDPRAAQIAQLKAREAMAREEFAAEMSEIRERISKLQALTYEAA